MTSEKYNSKIASGIPRFESYFSRKNLTRIGRSRHSLSIKNGLEMKVSTQFKYTNTKVYTTKLFFFSAFLLPHPYISSCTSI